MILKFLRFRRTKKNLTEELSSIDTTLQKTTVYSLRRKLLFNFLGGLFYALGAFMALALVIPLLIIILRQVDWIPYFGEFFSRIAQYMEFSFSPK